MFQIGLIGEAGLHARDLVIMGLKLVKESVQVVAVQETQKKLKRVTYDHACRNGEIGETGRHVQLHAEADNKCVSVRVRTANAREIRKNQKHVPYRHARREIIAGNKDIQKYRE